jgi:hypothetical protein
MSERPAESAAAFWRGRVRAQVGDRICIRSRTVGRTERTGVVVATRAGHPPFEVRWDGGEQTALVFPGPDATIVPAPLGSTRPL